MQDFSQQEEWNLKMQMSLTVTEKNSSDRCRFTHYWTRDSRLTEFSIITATRLLNAWFKI